ncbi:hypothetical protein PT276_02425 [Orbaceae bacterium ESL0721]|nr:hypothetical protein [Orbaceae bacterium ESL0721]
MYHYQLVSADRWQDESARLAGLDYFSRPNGLNIFMIPITVMWLSF